MVVLLWCHTAKASGFTFPVSGFFARGRGYTFGDSRGGEGVHSGEDIILNPGTAVLAIADGQVRLVKTDSQGYEQVVVIEHTLPNGYKFCSIYGHLSEKPDYPLIATGWVSQGAIVGYVGWDEENGIGGPHLHFGIRKGSYIGKYEGRIGVDGLESFFMPSAFIQQVGFFADGWHEGDHPYPSSPFLSTYLSPDPQTKQSGYERLGTPFSDDGGGAYVHEWCNDQGVCYDIWLQNFTGGHFSDGDGQSALVWNPTKQRAYLLKQDFSNPFYPISEIV